MNQKFRHWLVGITIVLIAGGLSAEVSAQGIPPAERRSGFDQMGADPQGMQRDDTRNPAMLWVLEGSRHWVADPGTGKPACAGCHNDAAESMKGVAARYPAFDQSAGKPIDLAGRIQQCQSDRQGKPASPRESRALLALASYVGMQSRGARIEASADQRLAPSAAKGQQLFTTRLGQLNLSCAQCHDDNWGKSLGSSVVPQGHPNGYPLYRLEWQGVGSLQRRIRNCLTGVRAEPFAYGDPDLINLELYLRERAVGLVMEIPAVRP
ncbi:MAG: sulfur oxidation c-type cytochrome SoxA [Beijerinckiaceae bacterium]